MVLSIRWLLVGIFWGFFVWCIYQSTPMGAGLTAFIFGCVIAPSLVKETMEAKRLRKYGETK